MLKYVAVGSLRVCCGVDGDFPGVLNDHAAGVVRKGFGRNQDDVHQSANAEYTRCEEPEDARADFTDIEAVDAQPAEKDGEEQRREPVFVRVGARALRLRFLRAVDAASADAYIFARGNLFAAGSAISGFHK